MCVTLKIFAALSNVFMNFLLFYHYKIEDSDESVFFSEDNEVLGNKYDIVCFLYSVILTRGPNRFVTKIMDL